MKKFLISMAAMLLTTASLWARPGYRMPVDVPQPDGTRVTLLMQGDEFQSFMTTTDGFTVIKGDDGYYRYAIKEGGSLKASAFVAKNADQRQTDELAFLNGMQKMISADMSEAGKQFKERVGKMYNSTYENAQGVQRRALTPGTISSRIDYSKFKGLVILVNWNDRTFNINNPVNFYRNLTSQKNYIDNTKTVYPYNVKGSARDYFYTNSMGIFDPEFDVLGPITIDYSCLYPCPKDAQGNVKAGFTARMNNLLKAIMNQLNTMVNFNDYDLNNDNFIDMVYIIFAGYGSYVSGNNIDLIWPHADDYSAKYNWYQTYSDIYGLNNYNHGKKFGRYACSVEIQDLEADAAQHAYPDGIGTICHEFSHVLGLADHYDTSYGKNGVPTTPGGYDIMDNGADYNQGLSPVGYSAFERHVLGFADNTVTSLELEGNYTLQPFDTGNTAYIVKTAKDGEKFYVENRQKQGWDESLPGHGLIVWRIDTSNNEMFTKNVPNNTPGSECVQVLGKSPYKDLDLTTANNSVWNEKGAVIDLYSITDNNGIITFEAGKNLYPTVIEDFETTPFSESDVTGATGKFCSWDFTNAGIVSTACGYGKGLRVAQLRQYGLITSSALEKSIRTLDVTVSNGGEAVRFAVRTSSDGTNWTILNTTGNESMVNLSKNQSATMSYRNIPAGSKIQFVMSSTSANAFSYIDDIKVSLGNATAITTINSDAADQQDKAYNLAGQRISDSYKGLVIKNGKKYVVK